MSAPDRAPFLAKLLVSGAGIMSLANSITIPFLAIFLRRELGLDPATIGLLIGSSVFSRSPPGSSGARCRTSSAAHRSCSRACLA